MVVITIIIIIRKRKDGGGGGGGGMGVRTKNINQPSIESWLRLVTHNQEIKTWAGAQVDTFELQSNNSIILYVQTKASLWHYKIEEIAYAYG